MFSPDKERITGNHNATDGAPLHAEVRHAAPLRVAIQGVAGCFHDAAARRFYGPDPVQPVECETFADMFAILANDPSLRAVMAIENTIAGSLLPNHELLRRSRMRIVGEHKMRISHVLCALPGQRPDNITEVHSHPMALQQCEEYLLRHRRMRMVEDFDTAGSARNIAAAGRTGVAAVCGEFAANLYGLEILERGIETNKHNFTRFLALEHEDSARTSAPATSASGIDKASVVFTLPHTKGALSKVLTILSFYDINLSKIQSLPLIGREWEYRFYVDLTFDEHHRYRQAIDAILPLLSDFRVLGEYKSEN